MDKQSQNVLNEDQYEKMKKRTFKQMLKNNDDIYIFRILERDPHLIDQLENVATKQKMNYQSTYIRTRDSEEFDKEMIGDKIGKPIIADGSFSSVISQEQNGYNVIMTEINSDIINTLLYLNRTSNFENDTYFQNHVLKSRGRRLNKTTSQSKEQQDLWTEIKKLLNQKQQRKQLQNLIAFTYNESLINLTFDELSKINNLKLRYMQVDSHHKCMPHDYNMGFETFIIYTFFQASEGQGYLRFYQNDKIINYGNDMRNITGPISYLKIKFQLCLWILFEILMLVCMVLVSSEMFQMILLSIVKNSRNNNVVISVSLITKIYGLSCVSLIENVLSMKEAKYIVFAMLIAHDYSFLLLRHSKYYYKFYGQFLGITYLYYMYLVVYPYSFVNLAHLTYILYLAYYMIRDMNRFAFQFENLIALLDSGFETIVTSNIRNALARRVEREFLRDIVQIYRESVANNNNNANNQVPERSSHNSGNESQSGGRSREESSQDYQNMRRNEQEQVQQQQMQSVSEKSEYSENLEEGKEEDDDTLLHRCTHNILSSEINNQKRPNELEQSDKSLYDELSSEGVHSEIIEQTETFRIRQRSRSLDDEY